jgi:hypothetical protein
MTTDVPVVKDTSTRELLGLVARSADRQTGGEIHPKLKRDSGLAPASQDADRGQAAFTPSGLALYDLLILRALCPWLWRCPNERILAAYRRHLSGNHLEVGVGTGYFLDHARFSNAVPRVALLDLNVHVSRAPRGASRATTRRSIRPTCYSRSSSTCLASVRLP